jgi:hypothetical protein
VSEFSKKAILAGIAKTTVDERLKEQEGNEQLPDGVGVEK